MQLSPNQQRNLFPKEDFRIFFSIHLWVWPWPLIYRTGTSSNHGEYRCQVNLKSFHKPMIYYHHFWLSFFQVCCFNDPILHNEEHLCRSISKSIYKTKLWTWQSTVPPFKTCFLQVWPWPLCNRPRPWAKPMISLTWMLQNTCTPMHELSYGHFNT